MPIFVGAGTSSFMKDGEGIGFTNLTTSQRDNLSGANRVTGQVIFNTDKDYLEIWTGSVWIELFSNPNSSSGGSKDTTSRSGYTVHTFTSPGTLEIVGSFSAEYLIVGGGGGGGSRFGGAGGAGGYRTGTATLTAGNYPVTVGGGGSGGASGGGGGTGASNTNALIFGGAEFDSPPGSQSAKTEKYNGSSWTESGDLSTARSTSGSAGVTNTAALFFGPPSKTEQFDGTSCTEV